MSRYIVNDLLNYNQEAMFIFFNKYIFKILVVRNQILFTDLCNYEWII